MAKTLKELNAAINSIAKRGKKLREDAHKTLVDVIEHYLEHGDTTLIPKYLEVVKTVIGSSISQAAIQWISISVSSLKWNDDAKAFEHIKKVEMKINDLVDVAIKGHKTYTGSARDLPFYDLEKETQQKPFDFSAAILQLITRAEKALEKNVKEEAHNAVTHEQIEILKSFQKSIEENGKPAKKAVKKSKADATTSPVEEDKEAA